MPVVLDQPKTFLQGLSDFWTRFFVDQNDLNAYYQGAETKLGQVYLDMLSNVLNLSLLETPIFNKELYKLVTVREDDVLYREFSATKVRHLVTVPDNVVVFDYLQNKIFEPDAVLERGPDFDIVDTEIQMFQDPFNPLGDGNVLAGFAFREDEFAIGGSLLDATAGSGWALVQRGDSIVVTTNVPVPKSRYTIGRVGDDYLHVRTDTPLPEPTGATHEYYLVRDVNSTNTELLLSVDRTEVGPDITILDGGDPRITTVASIFVMADVGKWAKIKHVDQEALYLITEYVSGTEVKIQGPVLEAGTNYATEDLEVIDTSYTLIAPVTDVMDVFNPEFVFDVTALSTGDELVEDVDYTFTPSNQVLTFISSIAQVPAAPYAAEAISTTYATDLIIYDGTAGAATISNATSGDLRELTFWAPDALVERNNLSDIYGQLIGFERDSSEAYRRFIRGIMQLYVLGPALQRLESAMNVIAGFPVIRDEGEVLTGYDDGVRVFGRAGVSEGIIAGPTAGVVTFDTGEPGTFGSEHVGTWILIKDATTAANNGLFQILTVVNDTTVQYENFAAVGETNMSWFASDTALKTVTTTRAEYTYPLEIQMRDDLRDALNIGVLTFEAFEPLTVAFNAQDYVENPIWWHDLEIPEALFTRDSTILGRYTVTTDLQPAVIGGGVDDVRIGDPGLIIGADDEGRVPPTKPVSPDDTGYPLFIHGGTPPVIDFTAKTFTASVGGVAPLDFGGFITDGLVSAGDQLWILSEDGATDPSTLTIADGDAEEGIVTLSATLFQFEPDHVGNVIAIQEFTNPLNTIPANLGEFVIEEVISGTQARLQNLKGTPFEVTTASMEFDMFEVYPIAAVLSETELSIITDRTSYTTGTSLNPDWAVRSQIVPFRHAVPFILVNKFLKHHLFEIRFFTNREESVSFTAGDYDDSTNYLFDSEVQFRNGDAGSFVVFSAAGEIAQITRVINQNTVELDPSTLTLVTGSYDGTFVRLLDASLLETSFVEDIQTVVNRGKPAHTYAVFR